MLLSRIRTFPGIQNRIRIFPGIQNRIRIFPGIQTRIRIFPGIQNQIRIFPGIQNRIRIFPGIRSTLVVLSLQIPSRFVELRYYSLLCIILSPLCSPSTTWRSTPALGKPSTVDKIYRLRNRYIFCINRFLQHVK